MLDPFEVLGLPRRFDLDLKAAEKAHRDLSKALHPDRHASGGASERRDALNKAADVNEAWRTIRDPVRRAEALFVLAGVPVGETKEPKPSPDFLMDVLDKREALADAKAARDLEKVRALQSEMASREQAIEQALSAARTFDASLLAKLGEMRFYRRFEEEASAIEDELAS